MSILKNLFAAVGAATLGAVAVGVVLGATTAMTADDDDFDLDELRDDAPCGGCRKCAEKNAEKDADNEDEDDEPVVLVHVVKVPCSMPEEKDKNGEKKASDADAEKVEENPTEKAEEPETSAKAEEDKAEKQ